MGRISLKCHLNILPKTLIMLRCRSIKHKMPVFENYSGPYCSRATVRHFYKGGNDTKTTQISFAVAYKMPVEMKNESYSGYFCSRATVRHSYEGGNVTIFTDLEPQKAATTVFSLQDTRNFVPRKRIRSGEISLKG